MMGLIARGLIYYDFVGFTLPLLDHGFSRGRGVGDAYDVGLFVTD